MNLIFQNAAVTYARSLVALLLGLFSSRWVLAALGADDFGISVAVGSLMAFGTFFGDLLRISSARYFAYSIGHDGSLGLPKWFHAACGIHLMLATILALVMWPVGEVLVRNVLVFSEGRLGTALVLLRLSVLTLFVTTASVPFGALFTAYQRFWVPSVVGIVQSVWLFVCAFSLDRVPGDRLVWYGVYMCVGFVGLQVLQAVCAVLFFWIRRTWFAGRMDRAKIRELLSFAGWNVFGVGGYLVAVHGSAFATNRFFGTLGNAAYGIAQQVQYHTEALANALLGAFEPAVTTRSASGNAEGARRLAGRGGLLAALLLAFFAVPLILEMETVLDLWLVTPPLHAGAACSILLGVSVVNKLTMGQQMAIAADGRIARWQVVAGLSQMFALPMTILYAALSGNVLSAAVAYATAFLGYFGANLYYGNKVAGMSVGIWLARQALPFVVVLAGAIALGVLPRFWMTEGFCRVLVTGCLTSLMFGSCFCILFLRWKQTARSSEKSKQSV